MRSLLAISGLLLTTQAQLIPLYHADSTSEPQVNIYSPNQHQAPMANAPGIQLPPSSDGKPPPNPSGDVILSDIITTQRQINIFAGFTRDISSVSTRLDTSSLNTTVLAPLNSAISALPRKPWEDPREYEAMGVKAYEGKDGEDRAHANMRRFTEAHIVTTSPWAEGERVKTLAGGEVWWEKKDGKAFVMPGSVEVERVVSRVANGEVWIVKGCLNYA